MNRLYKYFRTSSIMVIIITSCAAIVLALVFFVVLTTFTIFRNSIREAVNTQTRELSTQIVYNYENYINGMIQTSNIIQGDVNTDPQYDLHQFSAYFEEIVHLKNDITKIALYAYGSGVCLASSDSDEVGQVFPDDGDAWFFEAIANPTVHVFSVPYSEEDTGKYKVNISKQIKLHNGGASGVLKIEISFQSFVDLINKSSLGANGHITIIDSDYNVVYTSQSNGCSPDEVEIFRDIILGTKAVTVDGYNMTVNVDTLTNTKWRICVFINIDKVNDIQRTFLFTVAFASLGVLAAGSVLVFSAANLITSPIKQLELAMRKVEKADYFKTEEVQLTASKEVEALTRRFNKMMKKISELMERVISEQNAQRKSELKALQNQINPHFLYNTLDSIVWLIENNKNFEAGRMVVALAKLFRIGISQDRETIKVREEIEHVRNYLLIQSIRYVDAFDYEFDIDDSVLDCLTMKLILQPLVENSIYHGLKNKIDKGRILVSARREGDFLALSVSDNGYGMRSEAIAGMYRSFGDGTFCESVGLKNIYQRIRIYYGGKAELKIESNLDEGTTITIRGPVCKE